MEIANAAAGVYHVIINGTNNADTIHVQGDLSNGVTITVNFGDAPHALGRQLVDRRLSLFCGLPGLANVHRGRSSNGRPSTAATRRIMSE